MNSERELEEVPGVASHHQQAVCAGGGCDQTVEQGGWLPTHLVRADQPLCRGQNSVDAVWDSNLIFSRATKMSAPLGCFCNESNPEPTLSR
jgi:hypothetical protein